ncbi:MAG: DUF484 family protein [Nitrospinae bacterium]|nr:DUF484 family protein [Nitrospinota bacterium]
MNRRNMVMATTVANKSLRQDISALRDNLRQLIRVSKRNVEIQQKMDELGDVVLQCPDLETLVARSTAAIRDHFEMTSVTYVLSNDFRGLLPEVGPVHIKSLVADRLFLMSRERLAEVFSMNRGPVLRGRLEHGSVDFFPVRELRRVHSEALVPLFYADEHQGSINLGSNDPDRYAEGVATDYLRRLAHLTSLALANLRLRHELRRAAADGE